MNEKEKKDFKNSMKRMLVEIGIHEFQQLTKEAVTETCIEFVKDGKNLKNISEILRVTVPTISQVLSGKFPVKKGRPLNPTAVSTNGGSMQKKF